jgi:hypothetical protein
VPVDIGMVRFVLQSYPQANPLNGNMGFHTVLHHY